MLSRHRILVYFTNIVKDRLFIENRQFSQHTKGNFEDDETISSNDTEKTFESNSKIL